MDHYTSADMQQRSADSACVEAPQLKTSAISVDARRRNAFTLLELIFIVAIIGVLAGIAVPIYADFKYKAELATAKAVIREIESGVRLYYYKYNRYPANLDECMSATPLDPWGNPYQYLSSEDDDWNHKYRFDRNLKPLNSDFDLYSKGVDGDTNRNLAGSKSGDDVIRAGNGAFVDLAALY